MSSEPVSGISSDDPDVARILAEMAAPPTDGPPRPAVGATAGPVGASPPAPWPAPDSWPEPPPEQGPAIDTRAWPAPQTQVVDAGAPPLVAGYRLPMDGYPTAGPPAGAQRYAAATDQRTAAATDVVTCPECGQLATVNMARRSADDFCRTCDFPLFWAKGTVIVPEGQENGASLRRLPGTVGRAATAALICPHCSEPNAPTAQLCVRCTLSLHPVDIPEPAPPPEPLVVFDPAPVAEPEREPEPGFDWWWVVAVVMAVIAVGLIVTLIMLQ